MKNYILLLLLLIGVANFRPRRVSFYGLCGYSQLNAKSLSEDFAKTGTL